MLSPPLPPSLSPLSLWPLVNPKTVSHFVAVSHCKLLMQATATLGMITWPCYMVNVICPSECLSLLPCPVLSSFPSILCFSLLCLHTPFFEVSHVSSVSNSCVCVCVCVCAWACACV